MPFQIKDETAGIAILYIDDAGQMGFGSLPNNGWVVTVRGTSLISQAGGFGCGSLPPGGQAGAEGSIFVEADGQAVVFLSASQIPTVSSGFQAVAVALSQVTLSNPDNLNPTGNYAIY